MLKKSMLLFLLTACLTSVVACGQKTEKQNESLTPTITFVPTEFLTPTATPVPTGPPTPTATSAPTKTPKPTQPAGLLTKEEIQFFNDNFFVADTEYPGRWVRNNILFSEFSSPVQVDVEAMLYDEKGVGEELSKEEAAYLKEQVGELFDTSKFTKEYINELLQTYLGISLEESEKKGLQKFIYYEKTDAYYLVRSDALAFFVRVVEGVRNEDGTVVLEYIRSEQPFYLLEQEALGNQPRYQVILKETESGYQFLSNQKMQ